MSYQTTKDQERWAKNRKKRSRHSTEYYLTLIRTQEGRCAFSGIPLLFDPAFGTAVKGGAGCHARYAALDHTAPGSDDLGYAIVCYALNDIKGHLPHDCFVALRGTVAWQQFMSAWRSQAELDDLDSAAFYAIRHQRSV